MRLLWVCLLLLLFCSVALEGSSRADRLTGSSSVPEEQVGFWPTCAACTVGIAAASLIIRFDQSEPAVLEFATVVCKLFAKQSWVVCDGISGQFREEFFYVFRKLADSPSQICGILIEGCADASDPSQSGWSIELPPRLALPERIGQAPPPSPRPFRVLQLSDLHLDMDYAEGAEAECDLPLCCRDGKGSAKSPAGYWGTVGKCDVPYRLVEQMVRHINRTHEIDYILMSGDFINHVDWEYNKNDTSFVFRNLSSLMRDYFPTTPIYWTLGNHEGVPVNSFAPHSVDEKFWPSWLYEELLAASKPWLEDNNTETIMFRGSYSTKVIDAGSTGLRLIALNTGFCENTNFFLYLNQSDPDGTMSWFVQQLWKAEQSGEKVHVLAHIPPADGECLEGWARNYYRVVQRFSDTITAQFFGHVHLDLFSIFYEDMHNTSSRPVSTLYSAPSVTTFSFLNPAYRIYDVDVNGGRFEVLDHHTFSTNLSAADATTEPVWNKLYSAKSAFNMVDLSPSSWQRVARRIFDDDDARHQFMQLSARVDDFTPGCDSACQTTLLCSLQSGHHNDTLYCPQKKKGLKGVTFRRPRRKYT